MRFSTSALIAFVVLLCISPSHQYGTMFADNITSAFEDETTFSGIRTFEAFSSEAEIGVIAASNVAGFSVNTPGPIESLSKDLSIVTSQGIEFGSPFGQVDINAAGDLSFAGQRVDLDGSALDLSTNGDIEIGGLRSRVRANEFSLTTVREISFVSTGALLEISAPEKIDFISENDSSFVANNNLELFSQEMAFSSSSLSMTSNYLDIDGHLSFNADVSDSLDITAASIVEFASVSKAQNDFNIMNIAVSSGDIVLDAAGILSLKAQESSDISWEAVRNTFVVSRSASESIIHFDVADEFSVSATNQVTFANFDLESDITFAGQDNIVMEAPNVSVTTAYGSLAARNDLTATSSGDMSFEVMKEDIYTVSNTGNTEILSKSDSFTLTTEDTLNTHARETYIDTQASMSLSADYVSLRQNSLDFQGGSLLLNIDNTFEAETVEIDFNTSGNLDFTMGGDMNVDASDIRVEASKAFDAVTLFASDDTTIDANDNIVYSTDVFTVFSDQFISSADDSYRILSRDRTSFFTGDESTFTSDNFQITSSRKAVQLDAEDSITLEVDTYTHNSYTTLFDTSSTLSMEAVNSISFSVQTSFTAETEGRLSIASDNISLFASDTLQLLQRSLDFNVDRVSFESNSEINFGQNLPSDEFVITQNTNLGIVGDYVEMVSDGDFTLTSDSFFADGDLGITFQAPYQMSFNMDTFNVDANGFIHIESGGSLLLAGRTSIYDASNSLNILGPRGEFAKTMFIGPNQLVDVSDDLDIDAIDASFSGLSFFLQADDIDFSNSQDHSSIAGVFTLLAEDSFSLSADSAFFQGSDVTFKTGVDFSVTTFDNDINVETNDGYVEMESPLISFLSTNDEISVDVDGELGWVGDSISAEANAQSLIFDVEDDFSLYSGDVLIFDIVEDITLSADSLFLNGLLSTNFFGTDLAFTSTASSIALISEGATIINTGRTLTSISNTFTEFEAATFDVDVTVNSVFTIDADISMNAADGVNAFWAENFALFTAGEDISFTSGGTILTSGGSITYEAAGILDGDFSLRAATAIPEADIIFDATNEQIIMRVEDNFSYITSQYADFVALEGISFSSADVMDFSMAENFDFFSESNTEATIGGDMSFNAGESGNFQSGNSIEFTGDRAFEFIAVEHFLTSTGEQGELIMTSASNFRADAATSQTWKSSGNFDFVSEEGAFMNSLVDDISLFTTGGPITLDSTSGGRMLAEIGGDLSFTSGDRLNFDSNQDQTWTAGSTFTSTAVGGNVVIDGEDSSDITFTASETMVLRAEGSRNPSDGIYIQSGDQISFTTDITEPTTLAINPLNDLYIGKVTRPDVLFTAGGSPTQTGYSLTSDGNILTEASAIDYSAFGQWSSNIGEDSEIFSNNPIDFTTPLMNVVSDLGNIHVHGSGVSMTGSNTYTVTATGGVFEFLSDAVMSKSSLSFFADDELLTSSNSFTARVGPFFGSTGDTTYTLSSSSSYSTTPSGEGSYSFASVDDISFTSGGNVNIQSVGYNGGITFQGDDNLSFLTDVSGDISFSSAGSMDFSFASSSLQFSSTNQLSIQSENNRVDDLTRGDISFSAQESFTVDVGDSVVVSADRDILFVATSFDVTTTGDISYSSADDMIVRTVDLSAISTDGDIIFENSIGNGGNVNIQTSLPFDSTEFNISDDSDWNMGENIDVYSFDGILFTAEGSNSKSESLYFSTTAQDADLVFQSNSNDVSFTTQSVFSSSASDVFSLEASKSIIFNSLGSLSLTDQGDIAFVAEKGSILMDSLESTEFLAIGEMGVLSMEASGISRLSHAGIQVSTFGGVTPPVDFGTLIAAETGDVFISATESFELRANGITQIQLGYQPEIVPGVLTDPPFEAITTIASLGSDADIEFNLRSPQNGIGSLSVIAGVNGLPLDAKAANSIIGLFANEEIRFETESGFAWQGTLPVDQNNLPTDIFFTAYGPNASIELSTTEAASDIEMNLSSGVFASNTETVFRSEGETGSVTRVFSGNGKNTFIVDSTDPEDLIQITAYRKQIGISATDSGDIVTISENDITLLGRKGISLDVENLVDIELLGSLAFRGLDGDVVFQANSNIDLTAFFVTIDSADDLLFSSSSIDIGTFGGPQSTNLITVSAPSGNIEFYFRDSVEFDVDFLIFSTPNSLTIPMREDSITPDSECSVDGELVIAHNTFYYVPYFDPAQYKDTGISLCYCDNVWFCRTLSNAFYD